MTRAKFFILLFAFAAAVTIAVVASGCASRYQKVKYLNPAVSASNEPGGKGMQVEVPWLKNKAGAIDVYVRVHNGYSQTIAFVPGDITLTVDGKPRTLQHSWMSGYLAPEETQREVLTFANGAMLPKGCKVTLEIQPTSAAASGKPDMAASKLAPVKIELAVE